MYPMVNDLILISFSLVLTVRSVRISIFMLYLATLKAKPNQKITLARHSNEIRFLD